jgi:hypothetical protein
MSDGTIAHSHGRKWLAAVSLLLAAAASVVAFFMVRETIVHRQLRAFIDNVHLPAEFRLISKHSNGSTLPLSDSLPGETRMFKTDQDLENIKLRVFEALKSQGFRVEARSLPYPDLSYECAWEMMRDRYTLFVDFLGQPEDPNPSTGSECLADGYIKGYVTLFASESA